MTLFFHRVYDDGLAHASYVIGCQAAGEALVVDPRRDIQVYLDIAQANGMRITAVTETHVHADYLSGSRELAAQTGAQLYLSAEGGEDWQYGFPGRLLHHEDTFALGNITVQALHTPGHTPEHMSFLVTDAPTAGVPGYLLSGDFVFVGDVGRPDLLDEAAGGVNTRFQGAEDLFASLRDIFVKLDDFVQVHPAHGAGSPCGKALGAVPSSTVGYERRFAWWAPYVENNDKQGFIDELLSGQPDAHAYFGRMKRQNLAGPALLGAVPAPARLSEPQAAQRFAEDSAVLMDTRPVAQQALGQVPGALTVQDGPGASMDAAWVFDPEADERDIVVVAADVEAAQAFQQTLWRTGIDQVRYFITHPELLELQRPAHISPGELDDFLARTGAQLVDVRGKGEFAAGTIPGAQQLSGGAALWRLDELPKDTPLVAFCQSGRRAAVVSSALRRAGFDVTELDGSYVAWAEAN